WGAMSSYENAAGERYIYIPMWGPQIPNGPTFKYINGDTSGGSIMALQVLQNADGYSLLPVWVSGVVEAPDVPVVANGVVYAVGTGEQTIQNPGGKRMDPLKEGAIFRATPVGHQ